MNETNQLASWIRRRRKMILVLALIALTVAYCGVHRLYMANYAEYLKERAKNLLTNHMPSPGGIAEVIPPPGAQDEVVARVCVRIWLDGYTTPASLYIDGARMPDIIFLDGVDPSFQCWYGDFKGLHLAKVTFRSTMSVTLRYEWAFVGR